MPALAEGGSFVVPPGYPNDSFLMGVESGEQVDVTPAGHRADESVIHNTIYLDGRVFADYITKGSRDGRVLIASRAVVS